MVMSFEIEPYVGARPIVFGASRDAVAAVLGPPKRSRATERGGWRELFDGALVFFDAAGTVREVTFFPVPSKRLLLEGVILLGEGAIANPFDYLIGRESAPKVEQGIAVLFSLGVAMPAGKSEQEEDPSITVFRKDCWQGLRST